MRYFPVCLNINEKSCVVVGGGSVAARKAKSLLACGAKVTVISPVLTDVLQSLYERRRIAWLSREYQKVDIADAFLVIAATDDPQVQEQVFCEAEENNILVNVADVPEKCNFILPATVRRGDFTLSVSTGGKSPALARKIRQQLDGQFGMEYATVINLLGELRAIILAKGLTHPENKLIFEKLLDDKIVEWVRKRSWGEIEDHIIKILGDDVDRRSLDSIRKYFLTETAGSTQQ
jgi:precorrin-2 dehydrogenase/sirohydrochlorin ferrochelatase